MRDMERGLATCKGCSKDIVDCLCREEPLSNCCSAKPQSEVADDNTGRCSDCKEGSSFERTPEPTDCPECTAPYPGHWAGCKIPTQNAPVEPKEDTPEPQRPHKLHVPYIPKFGYDNTKLPLRPSELPGEIERDGATYRLYRILGSDLIWVDDEDVWQEHGFYAEYLVKQTKEQ